MRVFPDLTVDGEFKALGDTGVSGSLNDRQYDYLGNSGYTGALPDRFGEYSGFTPASLFSGASSRGFMFDFRDYNTLFTDTAGTTRVTSTGQSVARVNDKSGLGNHATQANLANRALTTTIGAGYRGIQFDGMDDFYTTAAIDFSNSDEVTVVAGVRKLSDSVIGTVAELTAAADANNGGFYLRAPTSVGGNNYQGASRGTLASATTATGFAAPISNVVTFQSKIAADNAFLRVNQTPFAPSVADQGAGNYANAIVYIGRRAGTSLPFNGVLTFLFAINRLLTANELVAVEAHANGRTGAF